MSQVTVEPCPLEWKLNIGLKVDAGKNPDKATWPRQKIRISIGEREDGRGTTRFEWAKLKGDGTAPSEYRLSGRKDCTMWLWAESLEEPWKSPGTPLKVVLKEKEATTVVLDLDAAGGGLIVNVTRADGAALPALPAFTLEGPLGKGSSAVKAGEKTEAFEEEKDGLKAKSARKQFLVLEPGDYEVRLDDVPGLLGGQGGGTWKLGPAADGKVKIKVEKGKTARVDLTLTTYTKAQFVAFNVLPSTKPGSGGVMGYMGVNPPLSDFAQRALVMKSAMQTAAAHAQIKADADTLKIFMAPEFYWRGLLGAYPVADPSVPDVSDIMELLRPEAELAKYADWLFVYGTAIGYLKHFGPGKSAPAFNLAVTAVAEWTLGPDRKTVLTVAEDGKVRRKEGAPAGVCARIPAQVAAPVRWIAKQGDLETTIDRAEQVDETTWKLYLDEQLAYATGAFELTEPPAVEVFNLALVQRGGPAVNGGGLRQALVYKEFVSHIDFLGPRLRDYRGFHKDDGAGRKILILGKEWTVLPTQGSTDRLGASPNKPAQKSEHSKTGLGGGSVLTIDGITFGVEVCRDHGQSRLHDYYALHAAKGEPQVQILLIPSWGMDIDTGPIAGVNKALLFNVDGPSKAAAGIFNDALYRCPGHPATTKTPAEVKADPRHGFCGQAHYYECDDDVHVHFEAAPGTCKYCPAPLTMFREYYCPRVHPYPTGTGVCPACGEATKDYEQCVACHFARPAGAPACACPPGTAVTDFEVCEARHSFGGPTNCCGAPVTVATSYYCNHHSQRQAANAPCSYCGGPTHPHHPRRVQGWTKIAPAGAVAAVPDVAETTVDVQKSKTVKLTRKVASKQADLFGRAGEIVVYPPQAIPPGEVVK